MQKYNQARTISTSRKSLLINKAMQGTPVSRICKEEHISRTIFYRWIKQRDKELAPGQSFQRAQKKRCPRTINATIERNVINYAIKKPNYTIRQYAEHAGIGVRAAWQILKNSQLSSRQERENYFLTHGNRIYASPTYETKIQILKRFQDGEKITKICQEIGISRTIFYKWLNQYKEAGDSFQALQNQRPAGDKHYRYVKGQEKYILALVRSHPEYSLAQILTNISDGDSTVVSRSGLYKVLKRLGLTSMEDRRAYAREAKAVTRGTAATTAEPLPTIPHYLFISFLSPPDRDNAFLLHILLFDELHLQHSSASTCETCSLIQHFTNRRLFDEKLFKEEPDE